MATEAQLAANRRNAQKSTGPRTAEGKAVVAQNAVQHGLLAREGVLRGEDDQARKERVFAPWRPADSSSRPDRGTVDTRRFEAAQPCDSPSWPDTRPAIGVPGEDEMCETNPTGFESDMRQVQYGTAVMSDTAADGLRKTNPIGSAPRGTGMPPVSPDHGQDAHATELTDPGGTDTPVGQSCETNPICSEPDVSQVQYGTTVMSDTAADGLRKTNPILTTPHGTGIASASLSGQALPVASNHGQDAHATHGRDGRATGTPNAIDRVWEPTHGQDGHATEPPGGIPVIGVQAQGQLCETRRARQKSGFADLILRIGPETRVEIRLGDFCRGRQTNPICLGPDTIQVLCGTAVRSDPAPNGLRKTNPISGEVPSLNGLRKTNPISGEVPSLRCQVSSEQGEASSLPTSNLGSQTHNSAFGGPFTLQTSNSASAKPQSRETNPIGLSTETDGLPGEMVFSKLTPRRRIV